MKQLSNLIRLNKKRKRVGRGGDRGGTSGKGHKGQKARSGPTLGVVFEGGQMPLTRRLPKRGFTNARFKKEVEIVNLRQLNVLFESGAKVDRESLVEKGIISQSSKALIKILGNGTLDKKLIVHADAFSGSAAQAITDKGGEVHVTKEK
jgi:large subunit ribosomal protein L15